MIKIAPNITIESNDADNLLRIPIINKVPGINSANTSGICISTGIPLFVKKFVKPGLSLDIP